MAVAEAPHVLTEPQIAHAADRPCRKPEVRPLDRDLARAVVAIRQRDGVRATGEVADPYLGPVARTHAARLTAERILIDGEDLRRAEERACLVGHRAEVIPGHERRREHRPKPQVRAVLERGHPAVPDLEHVRIVPVARPGVAVEARLTVEHAREGGPRVLDVPAGAPQVPDRRRPLPRTRAAPLADREHDGSFGRSDRQRPLRVERARPEAVRVAPVDLYVVDAPLGEPSRVTELVAEARGKSLTRVRPGVGVDAEPQAQRVHVVGDRPDPVRELRRVGDEVASGVALTGLPPVVDHDVAVAGLAHPGGDDRLGGLADEDVVDLRAEPIPAVPAHRGRRRQPVVGLPQSHGPGSLWRSAGDTVARCVSMEPVRAVVRLLTALAVVALVAATAPAAPSRAAQAAPSGASRGQACVSSVGPGIPPPGTVPSGLPGFHASWFQFTIQAPQQAGTYRLYIRPLVEGANWMEDFGVFWQVTVKAVDLTGVLVSPATALTQAINTTRSYTAQANGITGCLDLAFVDAATYPTDGSFRDAETDASGKVVGDDKADLSTAATFSTVNGVQKGTSYVDCVVIPPSGTIDVTVTSANGNANVRPIFFQDLNNNNALDRNPTNFATETVGVGAPGRFIPPNAASSSYTITVGAVNTDEDYFVDAAGTKTFRYDANDSFQLGSTNLTLAQFEQLISTGDGVTMTYSADATGMSSFTITSDVGRAAVTVVGNVDDYDNENVQDDIQITITEPPTNVDDIVYQVWGTSVTAIGPSGESSGGGDAPRGTPRVPRGRDTAKFLDRQISSGFYCYRVGVTNPVTNTTLWAYSNFITVETPPTPVGPNADPRSIDARVTTVAGLANTFDAGDVIKIAFSKDMKLATGARLQGVDADGTFADIVCGTSGNAGCALNTATETLAGTPYGPNRVLTITLTANPTTIQPGSTPGLQLPATVSDASGITDLAGNPWDVLASPDGVLGSPD